MSYHRSKAPNRRPRGAKQHSVVALAVAAGAGAFMYGVIRALTRARD